MRRGVVLLVALVMVACAEDVFVAYPSPSGGADTGTVLVRFTDAMTSVSVRVDGVLVAEDEHTERVEVTGVPVGARELTVVASPGSRVGPVDRTERVDVRADRPAVVLVATPARSLGYWIQSAAVWIAWGLATLAADLR